MSTLQERIDADGITSMATYGTPEARIPEWAREGHDAWTVTLRLGRRSTTVPFFMGPAHHRQEPTTEDVLSVLLSDASAIENNPTFEEFAREFGDDVDSRSAERTYRLMKIQTNRLRKFLGDKYEAYLWETGQD